MPCVVSGKIDAGSNDYYKISVKAGQEVSFEVLGRRLGGSIDPQINLIDPKTMRELPKSHSNDSPGAQTDPRLRFVFQKEGEYLVEVRDVSYRGGDDFHYRLRMGDFPMATSPIPMAMKRGTKGNINFAGPAVETALSQEVVAPVDPLLDSIWIAPKGKSGLTGWPVCVLLSDLTETMELEPNNEPAKANKIAIPSAITARLLEKGDLDHFSFTAKKDQRLIIEATSQDLYSPTEVYMALKDANIKPEVIDYINAHATSTVHGDMNEALAIDRVFGLSRPPVSSTKSMTGHECWMAGASEVVYSMLMMKNSFIAPNINFENPDEFSAKLNIADKTLDRNIDVFLSNSFGFGGTNSSLIIKKIK